MKKSYHNRKKSAWTIHFEWIFDEIDKRVKSRKQVDAEDVLSVWKEDCFIEIKRLYLK